MAFARTCIRLKKFRRIFLDDAFLFAGVLCLTIGVGLVYANVSFLYAKLGLPASVQNLSAAYIEHNQNIQDASLFFTTSAIISVKYVYMLHFRSLIRRLHNLMLWWWCVLAVLILATPSKLLTFVIACPASGPAILGEFISTIYDLEKLVIASLRAVARLLHTLCNTGLDYSFWLYSSTMSEPLAHRS